MASFYLLFVITHVIQKAIDRVVLDVDKSSVTNGLRLFLY